MVPVFVVPNVECLIVMLNERSIYHLTFEDVTLFFTPYVNGNSGLPQPWLDESACSSFCRQY